MRHRPRVWLTSSILCLAGLLGAGCSLLLGDPFDVKYKPHTDTGSVAASDSGPSVPSDAMVVPADETPRERDAEVRDPDPPQETSSDTKPPKATGPAADSGVQPSQSDAGRAPPDDDGGAGEPGTLAACEPPFKLSNDIVYPQQLERLIELNGVIDTTPGKSPLCSSLDDKKCIIAADEIRARKRVQVWVGGTRPLVLVAAHDLVIEAEAILNLAGGDGFSDAGPGDHTLGTAKGPGGGGGGADQGAGSACGAGGGDRIDASAGLVGGGNGSVRSDPLNCIAGGRGGGAVQLISLCGKIEIAGYVDASGGGGVGGLSDNRIDCPDGLGGGAGGLIWIQARELTIAPGRVWIQLYGGAGGGGGCFQGDTPVPGGTAMRRGPGAAATCENGYAGGMGGAPGIGEMPPGIGGAPTIGMSGAGRAACGGGGGSRGRLVLESVSQSCEDVAPSNSGECTKRP